MTELQLGDGVLMKAFKWHSSDGNVVLSFGGPKPKGEYHLFMWLGTYSDNDETKQASADDRLNALGWVFDPKAAAQAFADRKTKQAAA
jgi:hypothetical protein